MFFFNIILYFPFFKTKLVEHNHAEDTGRVEAAQQAGCLIYRPISTIDSKMNKMPFDCTMLE